MPHLIILYTKDLEEDVNISKLCRELADEMILQIDENQKFVFPKGGIRVLAYQTSHYAIADSSDKYSFLYANLRIGSGRSTQVHKKVGDNLSNIFKKNLAEVLAKRPVGVTFQIDESITQVYDLKYSSLHSLFDKK